MLTQHLGLRVSSFHCLFSPALRNSKHIPLCLAEIIYFDFVFIPGKGRLSESFEQLDQRIILNITMFLFCSFFKIFFC